MNIIRPLFVFFLVVFQSCETQTIKQTVKKVNGVSFVASSEAINKTHVDPVVSVINANYVAIMPFGFVKSLSHPEIIYNTDRQWFGETIEGAKQYIKELRKQHIKIMLKPQIWVWNGEFTGYIEMNSEDNWKALEKSYSSFILEYAQLAEEVNSEIFCIGTELEQFIENRPQYWSDLIAEIRKIYKGKLTYAANWDEFKRTPFWGDLDFIGIDAYFPVSDEKTPTIAQLKVGWMPHKTVIKAYSDKYNKPILFTEFGYRSVDYSGKEPWKSDRDSGEVNLQAQINTTQALFETFWDEDWLAGGFLWKWFINHNEVGGKNNTMFTPQNKPVEAVIKEHYETYK